MVFFFCLTQLKHFKSANALLSFARYLQTLEEKLCKFEQKFQRLNSVLNEQFFVLDCRVNEYKVDNNNAELSKTAGELVENATDPKFANSKVIFFFNF